MNRTFIALTLAAAASAGGLALHQAVGQGSSRAASTLTKAIVRDRAMIPVLLASGGRVVADYGSFVVVESAKKRADLAVAKGTEVREDMDRIELNAGPILTKSAEAQSARQPVAAFTGKRLHLIQFAGPVKPDWHAALGKAGVKVVCYIPENAYLVYGDAKSLQAMQADTVLRDVVQWDGVYADSYKVHPDVRVTDSAGNRRELKTDEFTIQLVDDAEANAKTLEVIERIKLDKVTKDKMTVLGYRNIRVRLNPDQLAIVAAQPEVVSIMQYLQPKKNDERQNQIMAGNLTGNAPTGPGYLAWLTSKGFTQEQFTASGIVVDVTDSAIDNGTTLPFHFGLYTLGDFAQGSRVVFNRVEGTGGTSGGRAVDGHGNLNTHIVGGYNNLNAFPHVDGSGFRFGLGIAPYVKFGCSTIFDPNFSNPDYEDMRSRGWRDGATINTNSWGAAVGGAYDTDAQAYDALVRDAAPAGSAVPVAGNQEVVILFSAGNSGSGANTIGTPGTAKNVITVGAAENVQPFGGADGCAVADTGADNANDIIGFSSRGPCDDGRIKPEIQAPGTHISGGVWQVANPGVNGQADPRFDASGVCAGPNGSNFFPTTQQFYTASSGTSHSCPATAGTAALLRQFYINRGVIPPSPALTKAAITGTARYMTGVSANDTLPSNNQGYGMVNMGMLFDGVGTFVRDQLPADRFTATGQSRTFNVTVRDNTKPVRVMLAWTDAPGSTTGNAYNNNLDLTVTAGGNTYRGNVFTGANSVTGGTADIRNNYEGVFLPAGVTGAVTITVNATNIVSDGVPNNADALDQDFALYAYNVGEAAPFIEAGAVAFTAESISPANSKVDPGETVTINFTLKNTGLAAAANLTATLQATGGVTNPSAAQNYGALAADASAARSFTFTAAANISGGIPITFAIADGATSLGTVTFTLPAGRPAIASASTLAITAESITPANNLPDQGETVTVDLTIRNSGDQAFNNLVGTLAANAPVSNPSAAQNYGSIAPGASVTRSFTFTVNGTPNTTYSLVLNLQDGATNFGTASYPGFRIARAAAASLVSVDLVSQSATPLNDWPDTGEVVTVTLNVQNSGESAFQNLNAVLAATGGVLAPSSVTPIGVLAGGATASRTFQFTGGAACGTTLTATFNLTEGGNAAGSVTRTWLLGAVTRTNANAITINDNAPANPYPSTISVSGAQGTITSAKVKLKGLRHTFPDDLDILLVGPQGQSVVLMSDCGGSTDITGVDLTFDDAATASVPDSTVLTTGSYKPTNITAGDVFASPAPTTTPGTTMSVFNGTNPNGTWSLYVVDDAGQDVGAFDGGWDLILTTNSGGCADTTTDLSTVVTGIRKGLSPNQVISPKLRIRNGANVASGVTFTANLPVGLSVGSVTSSLGTPTYTPGTGVITLSLETIPANTEVVISVNNMNVGAAGAKQITTTLAGLQVDPNSSNNNLNYTFYVLGENPRQTSILPTEIED
ncbi:MAG: S8 family serine peptidase [Verrucomicrobia bacterium]|nr:S8 family serine peptidase [Verrucomicrobiota bacterium]